MTTEKIISICEDLIKNSTIKYDSTGAGNGFVPPYALIDLRNALREYYIETIEIAGCKE